MVVEAEASPTRSPDGCPRLEEMAAVALCRFLYLVGAELDGLHGQREGTHHGPAGAGVAAGGGADAYAAYTLRIRGGDPIGVGHLSHVLSMHGHGGIWHERDER